MPSESAPRDVHVKGDVSGTFIVGDSNTVTNTTSRPEEGRRPSRQQNSAESGGEVFAVENGPMYVTYNRRDGENPANDEPTSDRTRESSEGPESPESPES